ncbi:uncharacterized protein LOC131213924 [Anopheles bellator]|uniref:uncharacterized protein LOC131213924 n=1 Tax=Anopheles bellator TaxID=139047 RepID=UPI002647AC89|nr:uncharacterized protein LOC131213924 [Anopheles bellator]
MSSLSKYFDEAMAEAGCREILHPGRDCWPFARDNLLGSTVSNAGFFGPIAALRLLLLVYRQRTLSVAILRQTLGEFAAMLANALLVANCWTGAFCLVTCATGRIHDNYSVSLAPLLGTLAMLLMPAYVQTTHAKAIFVANLECWIKSRPSRLIARLRTSRTAGTLCFMLLSAGIARWAAKVRNRSSEFWFFTPIKERPTGGGCCHHEESCPRYVWRGTRTYFTFVGLLELVRRLIVTVGQVRQRPTERLRSLLRLRYRLILFLTLYSGTFRLLTCVLTRRRRRRSPESDNVTAGFLSGLWYALYPNYNIFNLAVSTFGQTYWNYAMERYARSCPALHLQLSRVPFAPLVWTVSMCYVTYSRAYYPWAMSKFALKFIDVCSNYASRTASENFARRFLAAR